MPLEISSSIINTDINTNTNKNTNVENQGNILVTAILPWSEVVVDMNDAIKHSTAGYASFNYESCGYQKSDLVKVDIVVNGIVTDPLSIITHTTKAEYLSRKILIKLKNVLSKQLFEIILQAKIGVKVVAKERIAPYRKDVLIKSGKLVGGGDITRKKKLLVLYVVCVCYL